MVFGRRTNLGVLCRHRSLGALRAPTSSWGPFGSLDFVLRALRALRPCDPRSFSQEGRHEGELPKNTVLLSLPSHDDYHECWVNKYRSFVDPAFVIIIMGREREQNRIFCDTRTEEEEDRGGIGHSSSWIYYIFCNKTSLKGCNQFLMIAHMHILVPMIFRYDLN